MALATALLLPISALASGAAVADQARSGSSVLTSDLADHPSAKAKKKKRKPKVATKANSISVRVLPQIAQAGKGAASPANAQVVLPVSVKPVRRTALVLEVKSGRKWKTLRKANSAANGQHVFTAAAKRGSSAAQYRVRVGKRVSKALSTKQWLTPSFSDTFSGSSLSKAWNHRGTHYNEAVRTCSKGDPRATRVANGTLRLSVLKDPDRGELCTPTSGSATGQYAYRLNGHVGTKGAYSFTYGIAAARVRFPKDSGQHAAFWLQVENPDLRTVNPKINGSEIDVIESYGIDSGKGAKSLGLTTGVHRYSTVDGKTVTYPEGGWVKNAAQYLSGPKDSFHGGYHVFSVEWTPKYYIYRVDGKEYWRTTKDISGTPQFPVLSNLSSDYELNRLKGDAKGLPQHMDVDWIRVWETKH
ncbi:hypothetical protein GCM10007231_19610 [Nocardioides daphniae]|uniref:GH16 domain-containing protein n=1 Tax=Nocardioides daphniae TaxID=402297 RepID=A0ABQ1QB06_9ACTN|nr:hypothetical protein GCM10007231_19610 [Nocardioides daphniae]